MGHALVRGVLVSRTDLFCRQYIDRSFAESENRRDGYKPRSARRLLGALGCKCDALHSSPVRVKEYHAPMRMIPNRRLLSTVHGNERRLYDQRSGHTDDNIR